MIEMPRCPRCAEDRLVTTTTDRGLASHYCDVCSFAWDEHSYDDRQLAAALTTCADCGRTVYMVAPKGQCIPCRR